MVSDTRTQWVVVTDLDGTMLNHDSYDMEAARSAVKILQAQDIPIILNTSKTYAETVSIRDALGISDAFIVENGSCIYLPKDDFERPPEATERGDYWSIVSGVTHQVIDAVLAEINLSKDDAVRLSRCTVQQAVSLTGLSEAQAEHAIAREFSEPLVWRSGIDSLAIFEQQLVQNGLTTLQGGRFLHVIGDSDKGKATTELLSCYAGDVKTIVLGDSANDAAMLSVADISIIVSSPSNHQLQKLISADIQIERPAPDGWREAIDRALRQIRTDED